MDQDRVYRLIELIYDAAGDVTAWKSVLEEMVALTRGTGADLMTHHLQALGIHVGVGIMDADFPREYVSVVHLDPFLIKARDRRLLRAGVVGLGEELVPLHDLRKTEFYSVFASRHEYVGGMAAIIAWKPTSGAAIGISRHRKRLFGNADLQLMRTMMPHLQRAWHLHTRLVEADCDRASLVEAINRLTLAVLIAGNGATLVLANKAAELLLAARDGLTLERGTLRGASSDDTSALNAAVAGALATAKSQALEAGGILQLRRPSGRRPLRVIVSPLYPNVGLAVPEPRVLVFVVDPDDAREPDTRILGKAFGLTAAEVEVAALLMQDKSVKEISEWLGVSTSTVRFHLKQLFAKTGTSRQSTLVRLLSSTGLIRL